MKIRLQQFGTLRQDSDEEPNYGLRPSNFTTVFAGNKSKCLKIKKVVQQRLILNFTLSSIRFFQILDNSLTQGID